MEKRFIRSRIHQYFTKEIIKELYNIQKSPISDNNTKIEKILDYLSDRITYDEAGTGTNRLAIRIQNYIYKIALDRWGIIDNDNEFAVSEELQPFVTKTYETNGLIAVSEYVNTLDTAQIFKEKRIQIKKILSKISQRGYLLGDVGLSNKNFCNWGIRNNGDLVILDFAYIYKIKKTETLCMRCGKPILYDDDFVKLHCTGCTAKYSFMDIRKQITMEEEKKDQNLAKEAAYKLYAPVLELDITEEDNKDNEEEDEMGKKKWKDPSIREFSESEIFEFQQQREYLIGLKELRERMGNDVSDIDKELEELEKEVFIPPIVDQRGEAIIDKREPVEKIRDFNDIIDYIEESEEAMNNQEEETEEEDVYEYTAEEYAYDEEMHESFVTINENLNHCNIYNEKVNVIREHLEALKTYLDMTKILPSEFMDEYNISIEVNIKTNKVSVVEDVVVTGTKDLKIVGGEGVTVNQSIEVEEIEEEMKDTPSCDTIEDSERSIEEDTEDNKNCSYICGKDKDTGELKFWHGEKEEDIFNVEGVEFEEEDDSLEDISTEVIDEIDEVLLNEPVYKLKVNIPKDDDSDSFSIKKVEE